MKKDRRHPKHEFVQLHTSIRSSSMWHLCRMAAFRGHCSVGRMIDELVKAECERRRLEEVGENEGGAPDGI